MALSCMVGPRAIAAAEQRVHPSETRLGIDISVHLRDRGILPGMHDFSVSISACLSITPALLCMSSEGDASRHPTEKNKLLMNHATFLFCPKLAARGPRI
eukprot:255876-Rhodomonas_salina.1